MFSQCSIYIYILHHILIMYFVLSTHIWKYCRYSLIVWRHGVPFWQLKENCIFLALWCHLGTMWTLDKWNYFLEVPIIRSIYIYCILYKQIYVFPKLLWWLQMLSLVIMEFQSSYGNCSTFPNILKPELLTSLNLN